MQSLYEYTKIRENIWQIAENDGYSVPLSGEARWQCFWIPDTETVMYQSIIKWSKLCYSLRTGHCYNYFFARKPLGDEAGAFHSCELWYMFGTLDRSWRPKEEADYRVSEEMLCCWTNFMKTGNPSGRMANGAITSLSEDSKEIEWPEFTKEHPYVHTFL